MIQITLITSCKIFYQIRLKLQPDDLMMPFQYKTLHWLFFR
ncbi:hypothetical protein HMPREF0208_02955 [Citrobacter koseri]|nr:hypothetical protein HMPREF3207_04630 [Citrobacter koseri]KWZ99628.1 hypothetical protein HMPREF3220_02050 [Citrobacter koseri]KXB42733.1 hypothetical protein HMPREF0208_02955 [Citrobacter koseri]